MPEFVAVGDNIVRTEDISSVEKHNDVIIVNRKGLGLPVLLLCSSKAVATIKYKELIKILDIPYVS